VPPRRAGSKKGSSRLKGYESKRDFDATPEPAPGAPSKDLGRYVIHEHHASHLHWDLRLERDGALASWALPKGMPLAPGTNHFAAATEDHPIEYLDFHGEIPTGNYGAGQMTIWDTGTYECLKWEPRKVEVMLHGERLEARYALFPIDNGDEPKEWMIHRMDPPADPGAEAMPERLVPMFASSGELPVPEKGWAFEIKWDGVRAIAYSSPGRLRLESRAPNEITDSYPELARGAWSLGSHSAVLDGEIVAFDEHGRPSFSRLQQRMHVSSKTQARRLASSNPVTYMLFDLLWLNGHSLIDLPYHQRRELLEELALDDNGWQTPEQVPEDGAGLLRATAEQGLEGVLAKRLDSTYKPGARSRDWIKVKSVARQEVVIGGWMAGKGKRAKTIGALLMGVYEEDGALRYIGRVGSGFSERELGRLEKLLEPLARESSPFQSGERPPREAHFCEPEIVAEVQFAEWTSTGSLRQPSYKGTREDKPASEVVREGAPATVAENPGPSRATAEPELEIEESSSKSATTTVGGRELKLSNLGKVLYPDSAFTKRRLIEYYAGVAPVLLPHLRGRPLTVTRWPDGVEGKSFFQKQSPAHRPDWVRTATVASEKKPIDYTLADDLPTLIWLANLAAIELHTPLARAEAMERPTALVFDLDPGPPATVIECCRVALQLQGMFENLGLQSFAKTSGSKGVQIYVPLNDAKTTYEQTKPFAKAVAELLEQAEGDLVVSRMTKAKRAGKVLIDWSQNDSKKTTVCVYSLRATARPSASTPLEWDEVREALDSGDPECLVFQADGVLERVAARGDLFAPVLSLVQALPSF
jgi:bifunctional non-homologous end joining protein LigD